MTNSYLSPICAPKSCLTNFAAQCVPLSQAAPPLADVFWSAEARARLGHAAAAARMAARQDQVDRAGAMFGAEARDFRAAVALVTSRAFGGASGAPRALVPLLDLANHAELASAAVEIVPADDGGKAWCPAPNGSKDV